MKTAIEKHGWDGDWFLRAYDFFGNKVGSQECEEGKIFIESNGFCTMSKIQPGYNGLIINPCIPKNWDGFTIQRKFRGTSFNIKVMNPFHVSKGIKELWVDGEKMDGNKIPVQKKSSCNVKVVMG
jgi:cellobiose phosphorylase